MPGLKATLLECAETLDALALAFAMAEHAEHPPSCDGSCLAGSPRVVRLRELAAKARAAVGRTPSRDHGDDEMNELQADVDALVARRRAELARPAALDGMLATLAAVTPDVPCGLDNGTCPHPAVGYVPTGNPRNTVPWLAIVCETHGAEFPDFVRWLEEQLQTLRIRGPRCWRCDTPTATWRDNFCRSCCRALARRA